MTDTLNEVPTVKKWQIPSEATNEFIFLLLMYLLHNQSNLGHFLHLFLQFTMMLASSLD